MKRIILFIISSGFLVLGNSCVSNHERNRPHADSHYSEASDWNSEPYVPKVDKRPASYYFSNFDNRVMSKPSNFDYMSSSSVRHKKYCEDKEDYAMNHECFERERKDYSPPGGIPDWVYKKK